MTGTYGGYSSPGDPTQWDGVNYYNFNFDPAKNFKNVHSKSITYNWTCSVISDKGGKLQYASISIIKTGYSDNIIKNGDTNW